MAQFWRITGIEGEAGEADASSSASFGRSLAVTGIAGIDERGTVVPASSQPINSAGDDHDDWIPVPALETANSDHKDWIVCLVRDGKENAEASNAPDQFVFATDGSSDDVELENGEGFDPFLGEFAAQDPGPHVALILPAVQSVDCSFSQPILDADIVVADTVIVDCF